MWLDLISPYNISGLVLSFILAETVIGRKHQTKIRGKQNGPYRRKTMGHKRRRTWREGYGSEITGEGGCICPLGGGSPAVSGEDVADDELTERCDRSGVMPGRLEIQGLGEGPFSTLTGGAVE